MGATGREWVNQQLDWNAKADMRKSHQHLKRVPDYHPISIRDQSEEPYKNETAN